MSACTCNELKNRFAAVALRAQVSGLDYSVTGVDAAKRFVSSLHVQADIRQEDIFHHSFRESSFDVVGSFGLIEHFDDPREIIRKHVQLVRPGGIALIVIPDYLGVYGRWQRYFDPENLEIHNTKIMD